MIRRALFCTLSKAMQRYCGKFAKTTDAYSRTDLSRLKLVNVAGDDYQSYLAHLNTLLSLARKHVEIGMYSQEPKLIVPGTSQYFQIPSLSAC